MSLGNPLVEIGLAEVRLAVADVIAMADLHLGVRRITRSLARRASGRLRLIETIVRRLVFLLALTLKLAPPRPRRARAGEAAGPLAGLPEGTELARFPRVPVHRLRLLPRKQAFALSGPFPDPVRATGRASGPVCSDRLCARVIALQRVLADPAGHARRLARHLERIRAAGEPKPHVAPMASAFRLRPELGALAVLLPERLNAALEAWDNSS